MPPTFKMRVIIFNDKNNFEGSLNLLNERKKKGEKRFWRIELCIQYLFKKLGEIFSWKPEELKLIRTYIYTGEYTTRILRKHRRYCREKIKEIDKRINDEENLLSKVSSNDIDDALKKEVEEHIKEIKEIFENQKIGFGRNMDKQKRNSEGQKALFERLKKMPLTEYKTTPLKHANGIIYQKGVDVKLATDIVHLANMNAYDIALIFGGDTDLAEAIKLVRESLGKIVIIVAYYDESNPLKSSISKDLVEKADFDFFINLKDFGDSDIEKMSELRRMKKDEETK